MEDINSNPKLKHSPFLYNYILGFVVSVKMLEQNLSTIISYT